MQAPCERLAEPTIIRRYATLSTLSGLSGHSSLVTVTRSHGSHASRTTSSQPSTDVRAGGLTNNTSAGIFSAPGHLVHPYSGFWRQHPDGRLILCHVVHLLHRALLFSMPLHQFHQVRILNVAQPLLPPANTLSFAQPEHRIGVHLQLTLRLRFLPAFLGFRSPALLGCTASIARLALPIREAGPATDEMGSRSLVALLAPELGSSRRARFSRPGGINRGCV